MKGAEELAATAVSAAAASADAYERFVTQARAAEAVAASAAVRERYRAPVRVAVAGRPAVAARAKEAAVAPAAACERYRAPVRVAASRPDLVAVAKRARLGGSRRMRCTLPRSRRRPVPRLHRVWERS